MLQPGIILLREGTDQSQGKAQLISNINACQAVMDAVRSTLGPRGMDKLIFDGRQVIHCSWCKISPANCYSQLQKTCSAGYPSQRKIVVLDQKYNNSNLQLCL